MNLRELQKQTLIVTIIFSMIVLVVSGLTCPNNVSNDFGHFSQTSNKTIKLSLKVVCEEAEGFCELKKVLSEQSDEPSLTISNLLIIRKDFHFPTFVKIYSLRKEENLTMQSHIKIADSPPPIFFS